MDIFGKTLRAAGFPVEEESVASEVDKGSELIRPNTPEGQRERRDPQADDLVDAYSLHPWVYACTTTIAHKVSELPLLVLQRESENPNQERRLTRRRGRWGGFLYDYAKRNHLKDLRLTKARMQKDNITPIEDHDLVSLLEYVNPEDDEWNLKEQIASWYALRGNAYIEKVREAENGPPTELWVLPPTKVYVVPARDGTIMGYLIETGPGQFTAVEPGDLSHGKFFNPKSRYYGMGPIQAARESLIADVRAMQYNRYFFENSSEPFGLINVEQDINEAEAEEMRARWHQAHKGWDKAHRIAVLGRGAEYQQVGLTQKDMQFLELRKWSKQELLEVMGVPPVIIGDMDLGRATRENADLQRRIFWEGTMLTYLSKIEAQLNADLAGEFEDDVYIAFDTSHVEALQEDVRGKIELGQMALEAGWGLDEARILQDLRPSGNNSIFMPSRQLAVAEAPELEDEGVQPERRGKRAGSGKGS